MEALIVYHSKTGITKDFGNEIDTFLKENNISSKILPFDEAKPEDFTKPDMVLLGCWTSGLFLFGQHPDGIWKKNAKLLPELKNKKIGFFTTYKLATGSMFRNMEKVIKDKLSDNVHFTLKSKNGKLSEENKNQLKEFIN